MSFEICEAPTRTSGIQPGEVAITTTGDLRITVADLRRAKFKGFAVVLVDEKTQRVAIRPPRPVEGGYAEPSVETRAVGKNDKNKLVSLRIALKRLRMDAAKLAGRYTLEEKDDLLVINLNERLG